jgi:cytochrome c biogenesis factor
MKKKIKGKINFSFELRLPRELKTIKLSFQKIWSEMKEHLPFTLWIFKKIVIPILPFLIVANFLLKVELLPVVIISFIPLVYGNFLPDFDILMKYSRKKNSPFFNKIFLFLFAPLYLYYFVFEKSKPIYTNKKKEFHSSRYLLLYFLFLFCLSFLIFSYQDVYKHFIFSIIGSLGYLTHLLIDKKLISGYTSKKNNKQKLYK